MDYKICSRGHKYKRSSDCPVCPMCWPNYYKKHGSHDFDNISTPTQRALHNANIKSAKDLSKKTKEEILALHGMGPKSLPMLTKILKSKGLSFKR